MELPFRLLQEELTPCYTKMSGATVIIATFINPYKPLIQIFKKSIYRKFSIKGATPYKGAPPLSDPKAIGLLDVGRFHTAK